MSGINLDDLEKKVESLSQSKVFDSTINDAVQEVLKTIASAEAEGNSETKTRLILLKCKATLVLPSVSKEVEQDLQAVLKRQPDLCEVWIDLAECYLRRNAFGEAENALNNALRVDAKCTAALCKLSQVQRNRCSEAGLTIAQKKELLKDSVQKAHTAVGIDFSSSEAWVALALATLAQLSIEQTSYTGVKRAAAAIRKACENCDNDPDIHFNKGVIESLLGYFGVAACSFSRAASLDQHRLQGAKYLCHTNFSVVNRASNRIKLLKTIGKTELKRFTDIATKSMTTSDKQTFVVVVADILTEPSMQPLSLLTVNAVGEFQIVLLYNISPTVFRIGQCLTFSSPEGTAEVCHAIPPLPLIDNASLELTIRHYYVNPELLKVNGNGLHRSAYVGLQMSSRLFA